MLKETKGSQRTINLHISKHSFGYSLNYKPSANQPRIMMTSLSNKIWDMVKLKALSSVPKSLKASKFDTLRTRLRTKSLEKTMKTMKTMKTKQVSLEKTIVVPASKDEKKAKISFQTLKLKYAEKTKKVVKLACVNLLQYIKKQEAHRDRIWQLDTNIDFHVVLTSKKTNLSCDVQFTVGMKGLMVTLVRILVVRKVYCNKDSDQLSKLLKEKIETFLMRYSAKSIEIRLDSSDHDLNKLYELYRLDPNRVLSKNPKPESVAQYRPVTSVSLDTLTDKEDVTLLYELLDFDYQKRFIRKSKLYLKSRSLPQYDFSAPVSQDPSKTVKELRFMDRNIISTNHRKLFKEPSIVKERLSDSRPFGIKKGFIQRQMGPEPNSKHMILKGYKSSALRKDSQISLMANYMAQGSTSHIFKSSKWEKKVGELYKPNNTEQIDSALALIARKSFAGITFGKFMKVTDRKPSEQTASNLNCKDDVRVDNAIGRGESRALENNLEIFNSYFED